MVGGHCIGVDPYYLTYKAEMLGYHPEVILAGRRINDNMGKFIAEQTIKQMIRNGNPVKEAKVNVLGLTFKEDVPDLRNSHVIDVINELKSFGIQVRQRATSMDWSLCPGRSCRWPMRWWWPSPIANSGTWVPKCSRAKS